MNLRTLHRVAPLSAESREGRDQAKSRSDRIGDQGPRSSLFHLFKGVCFLLFIFLIELAASSRTNGSGSFSATCCNFAATRGDLTRNADCTVTLRIPASESFFNKSKRRSACATGR